MTAAPARPPHGGPTYLLGRAATPGAAETRRFLTRNGVPFQWVDLFAAGPGTVISWTSSYSDTGVLGDAEKATPEKGRRAYEEAVRQLVRLVSWFKDRPRDVRRDFHRRPPTMPLPWQQRPSGGPPEIPRGA